MVGGGAWGTTLSALASTGGPARLWAREPDVVATIRDEHENRLFLPGVALPAEIGVSGDLDQVVAGADIVVVAVPAQHLRSVMAQASNSIAPDAIVVSVAKGIEAGTGLRMTEVLADVLPAVRPGSIGVLAGPNLAREVIAGHPSATTVAFADPHAAARCSNGSTGPTFRVYTSADVVGCEIGGAVKNVIAIAAGVAAGLDFGMNTMAALVTRGLAELVRLGVALGGDPLTFLGLAGNGDLIATCGSPLSRNHRVGRELAAGSTIEEVLASMDSVAEGVATAPVVLDIARRHGVDMPIAETVDALLNGRIAARRRDQHADEPATADRAPRPRHGVEAGFGKLGGLQLGIRRFGRPGTRLDALAAQFRVSDLGGWRGPRVQHPDIVRPLERGRVVCGEIRHRPSELVDRVVVVALHPGDQLLLDGANVLRAVTEHRRRGHRDVGPDQQRLGDVCSGFHPARGGEAGVPFQNRSEDRDPPQR